MSQPLFRRASARRALGVEAPSESLSANTATIDEDLSVKGLVTHGLAALAISALGLAVAGSVALTAAAQSTEVSSATTVQGDYDQSKAIPAPESQRMAEEQAALAAEEQAAEEESSADGSLEAFVERKADGTSRNAVRAEIDRAVADQKARERGAALVVTEEKATETQGAAVADARSENLVNQAAATKREQARLEEEKRKAEEALRAQQEAAKAEGNGTLQAPSSGSNDSRASSGSNDSRASSGASQSEAPAPAPQAGTEGVSGQGASPIAPGKYTTSARWGQVGSWSRYHTGQDLAAPIGTPIRAAADGVVGSSNGGGWAGTHAVIHHDSGSTLYAHMSSMTVRPGQQVKAGQVIGAVGMTGRTFGPHLHFEYYPKGASTSNPYASTDPYRWMLSLGVRM